MPSIYLTTNLHNKMLGIYPYQYIGSDQNDNPLYLGSSAKLKKDINRLGIECFEKIILEQIDSIDNKSLRFKEVQYLQKFSVKTDDTFYNLTDIYAPAGGKKGMKHKKKKIVSQKWIESRTGRLQTEVARQKMSLAKLGKTYEEIYGEHVGKALREHKSKMYSGENNSNALEWEVIFPNGHVEKIIGLRGYCRLNNLKYEDLYFSKNGYKSIKFGKGKGGRCLKV